MVYFLAVVAIISIALSTPSLPAQIVEHEALHSEGAPTASITLPPVPVGRSTAIGGEIRDVDPVRDEFTLKVFGGQSMRVLYDARTQVYRDGKRISSLDLHSEDHASVETTLDGTKVFALKIHILSQLPEGECQGKVLSYNSQTGELIVHTTLTQEPITLRIPPGTPVLRVGQQAASVQGSETSDLIRGSIVDVKFKAAGDGRGVATHVDVLAVPGANFVFTGNLSSLDAHSDRLVILDPRDNQSYEIVYDPSRFPVSQNLHEGLHVRVTTNYTGSQYVATGIAIE